MSAKISVSRFWKIQCFDLLIFQSHIYLYIEETTSHQHNWKAWFFQYYAGIFLFACNCSTNLSNFVDNTTQQAIRANEIRED